MSAFEGAEAHRHDGFQVLAPLRGLLVLQAAGPPGVLQAPALAVLWPGVEHRAGHEGGTVDLFAVELDTERLTSAARHLQQGLKQPAAGWALVDQPGPLLRELVFALATPGSGAFASATVRYLAIALVERLGSKGAVVDAAQYKSVAVQRAVAWIHAHPEAPLTTADLASRVGTSARTLTRHFRAEVGQPLAAYVTAARMRRAAEALLATDLSVEQIAAAAGYASTSHFHRAFRRFHGRTPQQVRGRQAPVSAD